MSTLFYKTLSCNKEKANKQWFVVDAEGQSLGRFASKVAKILRGKNKTNFTPHADCGDFVIVINASKIHLTGNKAIDKDYIRYTGYPGGQRIASLREVKEKNPNRIVEHAVKGMLPKTKLGKAIFRNMYVYEGAEHKQEAQQPKIINISEL